MHRYALSRALRYVALVKRCPFFFCIHCYITGNFGKITVFTWLQLLVILYKLTQGPVLYVLTSKIVGVIMHVIEVWSLMMKSLLLIIFLYLYFIWVRICSSKIFAPARAVNCSRNKLLFYWHFRCYSYEKCKLYFRI